MVDLINMKYACKRCGEIFHDKIKLTNHQADKKCLKFNDVDELVACYISNLNTIQLEKNSKYLRMIDLFAGTGAFSLAFTSTKKVMVVYANDMVPSSKIIYDANFKHQLTLGDINDIEPEEIPAHDILTGGFPCQPFSIAGNQKGFDDKRSNVFWKILEIIDYHKPACIVLENVKNLTSHAGGNTFKIIKEKLNEKGYHLTYNVLNTSEITGIPQNRERIYIVGFLSEDHHVKFSLNFPKILKKEVSEVFEDAIDNKYYYNDKSSTWTLLPEHVTKKISFINIVEFMSERTRVVFVRLSQQIWVVADIMFQLLKMIMEFVN